MATQRGGTFFGFIVGLITGFAIAAAVAFFLMRSSPFAKKEESKLEQPVQQVQTATPSGQQNADPNQPMYREVQQRPVETKVESEVTEKPAPLVNRPSPEVEKRSPAVDPRALPASTQTTSKTVQETTKSQLAYLQAGAFKNREQADNMRGNLALLGYSSQILQVGSGSDRFYRVRLGPYQQSHIAQIQSRLRGNGFPTTVIK
jgi:cell division protein FtsN